MSDSDSWASNYPAVTWLVGAKEASVKPALFDGILTNAVYSMPMDIFSKAFLFGFYFGLFF